MNPAKLNNQQLSDLISRAVEHMNADEVGPAEILLGEVIASNPDLPQALLLMGVVRLAQGRHAEAETLLTRVQRASPGQPMVLFQLGNAHRGKNDLEAAIAAYRAALRARAIFPDVELALAATLRGTNRQREAENIYRGLLSRDAQFAPALAGLGAVLNDLEDYPQAETVLARATGLPAENDLAADMENSFGTAKMMQHRFAEALPHFERAIVLAPGLLIAEKNRATVLEQLGQPERAASAYRRVLERDPLDLKTHLLLNELLHRTDQNVQMLRSYDQASRAHPSSPVPLTAKGDQLQLLERQAEALDAYRRALRLAPGHAAAHIGLGRAHDALGDAAGAIAAFEAGMNACPDDPDLKTAFAYCLLRQADVFRAQKLVEDAIARTPHSQAALAVLGLCYRAKADSREDWLNGYDHLVQVFDLDPPDGYDDMAAFHSDLRAHLESLHSHARPFFSQTLRGGTRAPGEIFSYRHPLRDKLKRRVTEALERYIGGMKGDSRHPFLGRRKGAFGFAASWSSRMCGGGFHVNHIHTGWISSAYYIDVPEVSAKSTDKQGWLRFGEPSADLGFKDPVRRLVQPKPGRLVLFPSYLWHGTVPFHSDEVRMTIAFDAVPLAKP